MSILIRGGHVLDPALGINLKKLDVLIIDGKVAKLGPDLPLTDGVSIYDASGCFVSPGWIDIHAHVYEHATLLGINPDRHSLRRGVTTVVDAGSSGAMTVAGLRHFVAEKSETRVLCLLHIAVHGLAGAGCADAGGGESDHLNALNVSKCVETVRANRDLIVGIKVRLDIGITNGGRNEHEALLRALKASKEANVPLMDDGLLSCPGSLRPGDLYTHCFHGHGGTILDKSSGEIDPGIVKMVKQEPSKRFLLDVGHGNGSFDWSVAEAAAMISMWPDTISTDLHSINVKSEAVKDLANVMSKFATLGMPMKKVIASVTSTAAAAINRQHQIGSLAVGMCGDATIFKVRDVMPGEKLLSPDSFGHKRELKTLFVPLAACRNGVVFKCTL